jgi:integrase
MPAGCVGILGGNDRRKADGLELAAVQLGHKRMTTTDEHYNERDMDDLKKAAELIERALGTSFAPD